MGKAEDEADENVGGSSEELLLGEDEREELLFVEDLDPEGEGAEPLEEEVQETTAGGAHLHRRGLGLVTSVMIVLRNKTFLYETVFAAMGALAGKCSVCVCVCVQPSVFGAFGTRFLLAISISVSFRLLFDVVSLYCAVGLGEPLFTVFFWCDLAFFKASQTVVNAIVFKAGEMLNTLVLGIAFMYLW